MIKVAVINTYQTGGAAIAKNRLIKAIISTDKCVVSDLSRYHQKDGLTIDLLENLMPSSEDDDIISKYQRYLLGTQRTNLTNTFFSGEATSWDISNHPTIQDADLINLHWVSEMICTESLLSLAKQNKPIVWTIHDERPYTGGCHYTFGCENFSVSCNDCPQLKKNLSWLPELNLKKRIEVINKIPITFICPSSWIERQLRKSKIFHHMNHDSHVIHNSVDINTFKPLSKEEINKKKRDLNIKKDDLCLISGSFAQNDDRKGMIQLNEALKKLIIKNPKKKFRLLTFGKNRSDIDFIDTIDLGYVKNEVEMAIALNLGDLFLTMTKEDNLPNCIMESLSCGTPVISTKVGGVSEMIEDEVNGKLIERDNTEQMSDEILNSINKINEWSVNSRTKAIESYSYKIQSKKYLQIFERCMNSKKINQNEKIVTTIKRFPAINSFPNKTYKSKALEWYCEIYKRKK